MISLTRYFQVGLFLTAATLSAQAGTFFSDFNSGALPPGTHTNSNISSGGSGGAYLELSGGVSDSGCFKITKNLNSQNGALILDDLDSGNPIYGFDLSFNVRIGGGTSTPADGFAFVVAPDINDGSIWAETGTGSGLRFTWCIYPGSSDSQGGQTLSHPSLCVRGGAGGTILTYKSLTIAGMETGGTDPSTWWSTAHIRLNPDGSMNFDFKGNNILTNFFIPGYQDFVNLGVPMRFGVAGRTGGANENFWIDNLSITTYTNPAVGFSQQPFPQTAQLGDDIAFDVSVGNTNGVTYQWYSNSVAIAGATSPTLTITNVQLAASASKYKATATGPNNTATSTEVTLTVTNLTLPSPQMAFNFDDGLTPAGVTLVGTAFVDTTGGISNTACLKLVNPAGSAAVLVTDPNPTLPLYGFTARFKILVGGGTVPPADGFALAFGSDIPDTPAGNFEEGIGLGSGLMVTFDIYNNDGIFGYYPGDEPQPAPSIDVRLGGTVIATRQLPISFMETGLNVDGTPAYKDAIVQLNNDGTLNVVYHGDLVFDHLIVPITSFGPATNAVASRFAIAARTGSLNDNIWIDNFELSTVTTPGGVRITQSPVSQTILVNHGFTNTVVVNDPTGVTYQWYRNGTSLISGANSSTYIIPSVALGDSGATFTAQATKSSVTVTSAPATLTVVNLTGPVSPNLSFNFNDGLVPAGTAVYGTGDTANGLPPGGFITANGGVGDSGVFHITDNVNGQSGALVISNLYNGAQISAIAASWDVRLGGGSGNPADGHSFNFASDLSDGAGGNETGNGSGLSVCWDIYGAATDSSPAPAINIKYKGTIIATTLFSKSGGTAGMNDIETGTGFRTVLLRVDADGKLYMSWGERVLWNGLQLPNYSFVAVAKYGFYGRTGGENENQWIDNVQIQATKSSGPLTVSIQPVNATVLAGQTAAFSVTLSDPSGATYQWQKNGGNITGANNSSYTTPPTTTGDNGALFRVTANGASGTAMSSNVVLTVVAPITISNPIISYNFEDCAQPAGTTLSGVAYIACSGGIGDSGVLHLTDNINSQQGTFIMPDANSNAPVKAITAYFAVRVADGSGTPADGFSFVWAPTNNLGTAPNFGPDPSGVSADGFAVGFDTYNNNGEAPSFNVYYKGARLATKLVPYSALSTAGYSTDPLQQYADVFIRVNANGTMDLQYHTNAIFSAVPLPGFSALLGGEFAIGAATGGQNETHWVDNIQIATTTGLVSVPLGFTVSSGNLRITWKGDGFKLVSTPSLSPPVTWTDVPGGTASPYLAPLTGARQFYALVPTQ